MKGVVSCAVRACFTGLACAAGLWHAPSAETADAGDANLTKRRYDIAPGDLARALSAFAARSGVLLSADSALTRGHSSAGLRGDYDVAQGFATLLAGSGLEAVSKDGRLYALRRASHGDAPDTITVFGRRFDRGFKADAQESATRTPLSLRETPQSVSVVNRQLLDERQVTDIKQALESVAGVNVYGGQSPFAGITPFGFQAYQMRGFVSYGTYDLRDDGFMASERFVHPDLAVYERIEVVKGPSSVLGGRSEPGGYINRIRKVPLPQFRADVAASAGSFDTYRFDADLTGPLFEAGATRGRVVAAAADAGSFVDGVESELLLVAPSLAMDLTPSTKLLLHGHWQEQRFRPNAGFPLKQDGRFYRAPRIARSRFLGIPNPDSDGNRWKLRVGTLQLEQQVTDHWLATLKLNRTAARQKADQDGTIFHYGDPDIPDGETGLYSTILDANADIWSGELRFNGSFEWFGRAGAVALGADSLRLRFDRRQGYVALGTVNLYDDSLEDAVTVQPVLDPTFNNRTKERDYGVYVEASLKPLERLTVLMGARYDQVDGLAATDATIEHEPSAREYATTGRFGAIYDIHPSTSVYALYSQSFSPQLFTVGEDGSLLDPERGRILETGAKMEFAEGRFGATAAVFHAELDHSAIPAPGIDQDFSIASGLRVSEGLELELSGRPLPGWDLSFAGTLLDSRYVEADDPMHGSKPGGVADWQLSAFSTYEIRTGPLHGLGFGFGVYAIGERGISDFQTEAELRGYERWDLNAFYRGVPNYELRVQLHNVSDERYVAGADQTFAHATFGAPRAVLFTLRYRLGGI